MAAATGDKDICKDPDEGKVWLTYALDAQRRRCLSFILSSDQYMPRCYFGHTGTHVLTFYILGNSKFIYVSSNANEKQHQQQINTKNNEMFVLEATCRRSIISSYYEDAVWCLRASRLGLLVLQWIDSGLNSLQPQIPENLVKTYGSSGSRFTKCFVVLVCFSQILLLACLSFSLS